MCCVAGQINQHNLILSDGVNKLRADVGVMIVHHKDQGPGSSAIRDERPCEPSVKLVCLHIARVRVYEQPWPYSIITVK